MRFRDARRLRARKIYKIAHINHGLRKSALAELARCEFGILRCAVKIGEIASYKKFRRGLRIVAIRSLTVWMPAAQGAGVPVAFREAQPYGACP